MMPLEFFEQQFQLAFVANRDYFWYKDESTGRTMNAYFDTKRNYGIEIYMKDNGLTTYINGETLKETYQNAKEFEQFHSKEMPDVQ